MTHLTEETLNEYLDNALAPSTRADVDGHLAACADCRGALDAMLSLFAEIDALPDVPLEHNLAPAVVAKLGTKVRLPRPFGWVLTVQGALAIVILALLVPFFDFSALQLPTIAVAWPTLPSLPDFSRIFALVPSFSLQWEPSAWLLTLTVISACLLWLVGNGLLLLLPHVTSLKRRNS